MVLKPNLEWPYDASADGVLVLPVNCQGVMELKKEHRRFKWQYPVTYKRYVMMCLKGQPNPGDVKLFKEKDDTIALLFNDLYIFKKDWTKDKSDLYLKLAIQRLVNGNPHYTKFYSPDITLDKSRQAVQQLTNVTWTILKD